MDSGRLIVIEDDFAILDAMADLLVFRNYVIVGRAQTLATALQLVLTATFDCAVVGLTLFGVEVVPLIEHLRMFRAPYVLISGTLSIDIETPWLRDLPRLRKPFSAEELIHAIKQAILRNESPDGPSTPHAPSVNPAAGA